MKREVVVKNGQNLYDIAINEYGDVSFAQEISLLNNIRIDKYPEFGSLLIVDTDNKGDNFVKKRFKYAKTANFKIDLFNLISDKKGHVLFNNGSNAIFQDGSNVKFQLDE